jgi:hypothetical protein
VEADRASGIRHAAQPRRVLAEARLKLGRRQLDVMVARHDVDGHSSCRRPPERGEDVGVRVDDAVELGQARGDAASRAIDANEVEQVAQHEQPRGRA